MRIRRWHDLCCCALEPEGVLHREVAASILILSDDESYRATIAAALATDFRVGVGRAHRQALLRHPTWIAFRRDRDALDALVLDVPRAPDAALAALDAARRRDSTLPVVLACRAAPLDLPELRSFGRGSSERLAAYIVLAGNVGPEDVRAAVARSVRR